MPSPLDLFAALVGEWREAATIDGKVFTGTAVFEWLPGGGFLEWHSTVPAPFPNSLALIGDDRGEGLAMHYFDSRGIARLYRTTFDGREWRIWRTDPSDFSQRFFGTLTTDRRRIDARWEKNEDGKTWVLDFPLTYTRDR